MSWKTAVRLIIGLLIIGAMLYSFDLNQVVVTIRSARPLYLFFGVLTYSITFLLLSIRWKTILSGMGEALPLKRAYQACTGGILLSDLTPARIGDLSRALMIKDQIDLEKGVASVIIDRSIDLFTIFLISFSGLLLFYDILSGYLLVAASSLLIILFTISFLWLKRRFMIQKVEKFGWKRLTEHARTFEDSLRKIDDGTELMIKSVLLTITAWITHALRMVLVAKSVGYDVPITVLFFLQPLVSALSLLPFTISGLGLVEGGLTALLSKLGVPLAAGIAIALIDRAITVAFHILIGLRYAARML